MTIGKRPGGLTALAIIHIVFGALGILSLVGFVVLVVLMNSGVLGDLAEEEPVEEASASLEAATEPGEADVTAPPVESEKPGEVEEETPETQQIRKWRKYMAGPKWPAYLVAVFLGLGVTVLEILSGAGYLGQKRVLGRYVGNVYAILSLLQVGVLVYADPPDTSHWMILTSAVLPVITLALINTTFKDDLVH